MSASLSAWAIGSFVPALGWALLNFVWQGLIIAALAGGSLVFLSKTNPRSRYAICACALLACLGLPLGHLMWLLGAGQAVSAQATQALPAWLQSLAGQLPALVAAWSVGLALMALRLSVGLAWVSLLRRRCMPAAAAWQLRLDALALRLGIQTPVRLAVLPDLASPITVGFLRPLVLIPAALFSGMPPPLLEALLAHELAHVRRWDYLVNLLQSLVEALLFFHPVVWWLSGQMRDAREEVADALAGQALNDPRRLALALNALSLQQAACSPSLPNLPSLAMAAGGGKLLQRLERLLKPQAQASGWKTALPAALLACASLWVQANSASSRAPLASLAATSTMAGPGPIIPTASQLLQLPLNARHALILDDSSGAVLLAKDADTPVSIASITKLMTAMVVLDAKPDLQETLRIAAADISPHIGSAARLAVGAQMSRLSALQLILIPSDNRAAAALARNYPGGTQAFVRAMQAKAQSLGLSQTTFVDPAGVKPGNISTAAEVAKIALGASHYPEIARISSESAGQVAIDGRVRAVRNTNLLVGASEWDIQLSKTGTTREAGSCLTMRFKSGERRFTLVLLDADDAARRQLDASEIHARLASTHSS
ncbi:M56 family metallopeptidase [Paucibacter sp. B2R-40]|uniref:M56 family metallopeptidase n=1 Tax=Paucibacter sp. B2R-40 TaxID=2893554 RepID=UPI0021E3C350|nr:M56 family metallopeptidase [Paucibacter sp. B2R-40]MCV2353378.1 M56 family metallopeptidase [Paucibacter sp. B2R-40]